MTDTTIQRLLTQLDKKDQRIQQLECKVNSEQTKATRCFESKREIIFLAKSAKTLLTVENLSDKEKLAAIGAVLNRIDF